MQNFTDFPGNFDTLKKKKKDRLSEAEEKEIVSLHSHKLCKYNSY